MTWFKRNPKSRYVSIERLPLDPALEEEYVSDEILRVRFTDPKGEPLNPPPRTGELWSDPRGMVMVIVCRQDSYLLVPVEGSVDRIHYHSGGWKALGVS